MQSYFEFSFLVGEWPDFSLPHPFSNRNNLNIAIPIHSRTNFFGRNALDYQKAFELLNFMNITRNDDEWYFPAGFSDFRVGCPVDKVINLANFISYLEHRSRLFSAFLGTSAFIPQRSDCQPISACCDSKSSDSVSRNYGLIRGDVVCRMFE